MTTLLLVVGFVVAAVYMSSRLGELRTRQEDLHQRLNLERQRVDRLERVLARVDAQSRSEGDAKEARKPESPAAKVDRPAAPALVRPEMERPAAAKPAGPAADVERPAAAKPVEPVADVERPEAAKPVEPARDVERPAAATPSEPTPGVERPAAAKPVEPVADVERPAAAKPVEPAADAERPAAATPSEPTPGVERPAAAKPVEPAPDAERPAAATPTDPAAKEVPPAAATPSETAADEVRPAAATPVEPAAAKPVAKAPAAKPKTAGDTKMAAQQALRPAQAVRTEKAPAAAKPPTTAEGGAAVPTTAESAAQARTRARMAAAVSAADARPSMLGSVLSTVAAALGGGGTPPAIGPPRMPGWSDLEEQLGARLPVWIGSIALLLAGAFLVKYTFDHQILSPAVRVGMGALFGVALLGGAEKMRSGSPRVASGLAAAGIGVLFASFLAATNVFGLVTPIVGFGLMALTTAAAVGLSLRHGPLVAVLGLVGGFMTPVLIGTTGDPNPAALFTYLLILQVGLMVVTRRRGWWQLAGLTLVASMGWVVLWLSGGLEPTDDLWLGMFLLMSTATFVSSGLYGDAGSAWGDNRIPRLMARAAIGLALILLAAVTVSAGFQTWDWVFFAMLGAGCIALARIDPAFDELPWLTGVLTGVLLAVWPMQEGSAAAMQVAIGPATGPAFLMVVGGLGALYACGAYLALWGSTIPVRWASLSSVASVSYLLVGYYGMTVLGEPAPWGLISLGLGAISLPACALVARQREKLLDGNLVLGVLAAAATAFISLAIALELQREWVSVAWAAEAAALAWLAHRLKVPQLRALVWPLAALVGARLLLNPLVLLYPIGDLPVVNWLLYGYGVPIAAFAIAARYSLLDGDKRLSRALQWLTLFLGLALVTAQVRQLFHPGSPLDFDLGFVERGTYAVAWLAFSLGLLWADRRWPLDSLRQFAQGLAALALFTAVIVNGLLLNPLWTGEHVGGVHGLNWLLWVYGMPAALALLVASELDSRPDLDPRRGRVAWLAGLTLLLVLITLEVNHLFHGAHLQAFDADLVERGTYVAMWLLYALGLFAADRRWGGQILAQYGWFVTGLALVGALATTVVANPVLTGESVGSTPVLNWLLWVYGVPAALTLAIAWSRRDVVVDLPAKVPIVIASGLFLVLTLVTLEVRQLFHGAVLNAPEIGLVERGAYVVAWLVLALALLWIDRWRPVQTVSRFGQVLAAGALFAALIVNGLMVNPLWTGESVGDTPLFNWLLWLYGAPAALALLVARELELRPTLDPLRAKLAWAAGLTLLLLLITLEINHLFHGAVLKPFDATLVERGTYVVAWLIYAHILLAAQRRWGRELLSQYGWFVAALSVCVALVTTLVMNPILTGESAGSTRIANWLLWVYGVPAALTLAVAWVRRDVAADIRERVPAAIISGLFLVLTLVTLEVRQWFHLADLGAADFAFVERGTYVIAWLLMSLVLLAIDRRRPVQAVRWFAQGLAALALSFALLINGLVLNPLRTGEAVGAVPILNWLLWVYGVPAALGLAVARDLSARLGLKHPRVELSVLASLTLVLLLVTLEVRQLFHGAYLDGGTVGLVERSTYVVAWMVMALVLLWAEERWPLPTLRYFAGVLTTAALALAVVVGLGPGNPVLTGEEVGEVPVFNWLLWAYGAPAVLSLVLAQRVRGLSKLGRAVALALDGVALLLLFSLVTLEVRQAFQGAVLTDVWTAGERYSYSLAWILFATILLVIGIVRKSQGPRYASLAVMMLSVAKVFLYDTGNVTDLLRVASYLGLGISLLLLAWLYQRFVFVEDSPRGPGELPQPDTS